VDYLLGGSTYYWNGVNFSSNSYGTVAASVTVQNNTTVSWSTTATNILPQLVSGREYNVFARALDKASNYGVSSSTTQFLFDTDFATPTFTNPVGASVFRSPANPLPQIQGNAQDWPNHAFAGVQRNEIRLLRTPPGNEYWNGSSWVVNPSTWLAANGTLSWTFNEPSANWQDDTLYRINVRTLDLAGNLSPFTTQNFTYDSALPAAAILDPNASFENSLTVVSGTAGDGSNLRKSGLLKAEIAIQINPAGAGNWWDGNGFNTLDSDVNDDNGDTGTLAWISVTTTTDGGAWTLDGSSTPVWTSGQTYNLRVRAQDVALNFTAPVASRTFTYDNVGPVSTVTFPVPGQFPSTISQVQGTASDATAGILRVYTSIGEVVGQTTNYFNGTSFSAATEYFNIASGSTTWTYNPTITYTSGLKYLFRSYAVDKSSNVQSPLNAQLGVFFDNLKPTTTVTSPTQATFRSDLNTIAGNASDSTSGLDLLTNNGKEHVVEGIVRGTIATSAKGTSGFGYDPVFIPEGQTKTYAELGPAVKNQGSHRAQAIRKLVALLEPSSSS
jgi:XTP/dITP diphosphohydrolase